METDDAPQLDIYDDEVTQEGLPPPLPPSQPGIGPTLTDPRTRSLTHRQPHSAPTESSLPLPPPAGAAAPHIRHPYANGASNEDFPPLGFERQINEHPLGIEALRIADAPPTYDRVLMEEALCIVCPTHTHVSSRD